MKKFISYVVVPAAAAVAGYFVCRKEDKILPVVNNTLDSLKEKGASACETMKSYLGKKETPKTPEEAPQA